MVADLNFVGDLFPYKYRLCIDWLCNRPITISLHFLSTHLFKQHSKKNVPTKSISHELPSFEKS